MGWLFSVMMAFLLRSVGAELVTVFEKDALRCFRIPTMLMTKNGTLLAFAENRTADCGDTDGLHSLVLKRSFDKGLTWGAAILALEAPLVAKDLSNPNPVEVTFADGTTAILLHFDTENNPTLKSHGVDAMIWSFDEGQTWSFPRILKYPPLKNTGGLVGPSVGLQANKTIYFSTRFNGTTHLYFSEDFGKTWEASTEGIQGVNECSIAFFDEKEETILFNCRTSDHKRAQILFNKDGPIGDLFYPDGLIDPNCQGSIVAGKEGQYFLSNDNSTSRREHMIVKMSQDQGKTWDKGIVVWPKLAGYSQLTVLNKNTDYTELGLLFENGNKSTYERISFAALNYSSSILPGGGDLIIPQEEE